MSDLKVLLISTYELGRQPFGLASPAAWLRAAGFHTSSLDLSRQPLDEEAVRTAGLIAFYLPMHTATRIAVPALESASHTSAHRRRLGLSQITGRAGVSTKRSFSCARRSASSTSSGECPRPKIKPR